MTLRRLSSGFGLLEGARWYPDTGLLFSDMTRGGVYQLLGHHKDPVLVMPHRKGIGGLVLHADGGLVVTGRNVAYKAAGAETIVLLSTTSGEVFFNDLGTDQQGRILVGSVAVDPLAPTDRDPVAARLGRLYLIQLDGTASVLFDDIAISNGIAAAPTGTLVYHVDTGHKLVWAVDLDAGSRSLFVDTSKYDGEPDGLAVAGDGSVWVAMAGGGLVVGWDAEGTVVQEIEIPQILVTSVCFGGPDMLTLYVLTGPSDLEELGGSVYACPAPVPGRAVPLARVARSGASSP